MTCDNLHAYYASHESDNDFQISLRGDITPNPDIAGIGVCLPIVDALRAQSVTLLTQLQILMAFFATAGSIIVLALTAYTGGFLPGHFLHRIDRRVVYANNRNEHSKWRRVLEGVMLSLSDQQLVTGLAILVAGYYEMLSSSALSLYHWQIVVYLAWMSSSVHIASLTLLRDVLNQKPMLRNLRVAGMLILLVLLVLALWPTRSSTYPAFVLAKCLWTIPTKEFNPEWILTLVMLLIAYLWKLTQLFASSRGWIREWTVAIPEASLENSMRQIIRSRRSVWLRSPAYICLRITYISFVAYVELVECFAASVVYLCLAFPYGVSIILRTRTIIPHHVLASESRLTFGQLVPLFLLCLPILLLVELSLGMPYPALSSIPCTSLTCRKKRGIAMRHQTPSIH